jgi:hypothetical protein
MAIKMTQNMKTRGKPGNSSICRRKRITKQHSGRQRSIHGSNINVNATLTRSHILGTLFINKHLVKLKAAAHSQP